VREKSERNFSEYDIKRCPTKLCSTMDGVCILCYRNVTIVFPAGISEEKKFNHSCE